MPVPLLLLLPPSDLSLGQSIDYLESGFQVRVNCNADSNRWSLKPGAVDLQVRTTARSKYLGKRVWVLGATAMG